MLIAVLGGGIDLRGNIPDYVYARLDKAIELYDKLHCDIVLSGKYSFLYSSEKPPITEASKMAEYLLNKGVKKEILLKEEKSKDTIGNAYYLKKIFFIPKKEREGIIITSRFHLDRVRYIFSKIFGSNYKLEFIGVEESLPKEEGERVVERQKELLLKTKRLLSNMKDGEHNLLRYKLYKGWFYKEKRPDWVKDFVAKGK